MHQYILGLLIITFMAVPQVSAAFEAKEVSAVQFGESSVMFRITFELGYENYGMYIPIGATIKREQQFSPYLTYSLYSGEGEEVSDGVLAGLVFSNASQQNAQYALKAGEDKEFTFVAIYTAPEGINVSDYSLRVDSLPFTLLDGSSEFLNGLSLGELKGFVVSR